MSTNINNNHNTDSVELTGMLTSFDTQNELVDNLLQNELFNQELYDDGEYGKRYDGKGSSAKTNFFGIVEETNDFQNELLDKITDIDISNISKSYNKNADLYRNQNAMNKYVESKMNKFQKRNRHLFVELDNKIRKKEIYSYYYKKYNAQKQILKNVIFAAIAIMLLKYLNKNFKFLFTDTIFIISLGVLSAVFVINISLQLLDIFWRNYNYFDEYDFTLLHGDKVSSPESNENDKQKNK